MTLLYSPEWRALALEFCAARDAAVYSGPTPPPSPGTVPESAVPVPPDPQFGSGTTFFSVAVGEDCAEGSAGATACEAAVAPATTSAVTS